MSIWELAATGQHGALALGQTCESIRTAFGSPSDISKHIWKYDTIELHFTNERLWLIHCEFEESPLSPALVSQRLGLESAGLEWSMTWASLIEMTEARGMAHEHVQQAWGKEVRFGLATVFFDEGDGLVGISVHNVAKDLSDAAVRSD